MAVDSVWAGVCEDDSAGVLIAGSLGLLVQTLSRGSPMSDHGLPVLPGGIKLTHIGVDNLRALRMPEPVELRRLTFIVGRNGIGKSTFTRLFPLLRQSAERRYREPILFGPGTPGDGPIDFGSFATALRHWEGGHAEEMVFTLRVEDPTSGDGKTPITYKSALCAHGELGRVSWVEVERGEHRLRMHYDERGRPTHAEGAFGQTPVTFTGEQILRLVPSAQCEPDRLFGVGEFTGADAFNQVVNTVVNQYIRDSMGTTFQLSQAAQLTLLNGVVSDFDPKNGPRLSDVSHQRSLADAPLHSGDRLCRAMIGPGPRTTKRAAFALKWLLRHLSDAGAHLRHLALSTAYIGPARQLPARFYRASSAAVDRLDPDGENLLDFLRSLSAVQLSDLNKTLSEMFHFQVSLKPEGASWTIQIVLDRQTHNLVDVGFGYSQVLPVIVQLWASNQTSRTIEGAVA
ncbi:MAG: hypothetical protein IPN01_25635 [Deltaproteobacteria bacterium]|nr:hypothetical protein [Deltaproteobacteria bacterium]